MKRFCLIILCGTVALGFLAQSALALPQFKKEFTKKYVDTSSNEDFKAAAKKASCNVCHVKKEKKSVNNDYGTELSKLIEGSAKNRLAAAKDEDKAKGEDVTAASDAEKAKLTKELLAAFEKVEGMKSKSGKTYGELIKSGNLP